MGLPLCFQPDGGIPTLLPRISGSPISTTSPSGIPELQRDSLYRWFEMRATWDLRGTFSLAPTKARASDLFIQQHGEPSPKRFSVIVDSGWFELLVVRLRCSMPFFGVRPPPLLCSRRPHRTLTISLSPSCRAIVQVETRSLCAHGARCPSLASGRRRRSVLSPST